MKRRNASDVNVKCDKLFSFRLLLYNKRLRLSLESKNLSTERRNDGMLNEI